MDPYDYDDELFENYFGHIQVEKHTERVPVRDLMDEYFVNEKFPIECNNLLSIITASKILVD